MHYYIALAITLAAKAVDATTYPLLKEYSGSSFFDGWDFYGNYDNLTNGDAIFVTKDASSSLAYIDSNNHAIIKVDNTTNVVYNDKRNTVRMTTQDAYGLGSVWVADMYHVPYGCSVWPAFWSQAPGWPTGGEIDTFEGVNMRTNNQIALHTTAGCTQVDPVQTSNIINSTDCNYEANSNQGCVVTDPSPQSYGAAFGEGGGGVFVTEMSTDNGISVWFFPRSSVPDSLKSNSSSLDTSSLGNPTANYPAGGCNTETYFQAQHIIFDITLCGDFAGAANIFSETCSGTCYTDYVVGNGSVYNNAYFEVDYLRVFSTANSSSDSGSGSSDDGSDSATSLISSIGWMSALLGAGSIWAL